MVAVVVRSVASVLTVVIAILVATRLGESSVSKIIAAAISAVVIAGIEWFVQWSPRHIRWARMLFDARAVWTGVWHQRVILVSNGNGPVVYDDNAFAIVRIGYQNGYAIDGGAYNRSGERVASFTSDTDPTFTRDGRTISYVWKGINLRQNDPTGTPDRTGVTTASLRPGTSSDATGRVDTVAEKRRIDFEMVRLTKEYLSKHGVDRAYSERSSAGEIAQLAIDLARANFPSDRM